MIRGAWLTVTPVSTEIDRSIVYKLSDPAIVDNYELNRVSLESHRIVILTATAFTYLLIVQSLAENTLQLHTPDYSATVTAVTAQESIIFHSS